MRKIKRALNSIRDEFVYGGHLLSLGAVSIVFTSAVLLGIKITWDCLIVIYLGTEAVYLYNRHKEFDKDFLTNPQRTRHIKKYIKYIPLIVFIFSFLAVIIVIYFNKISALIFGLLMLFTGLIYTKSLKKFTRKIAALKNLFVSLNWALLITFLVLYYSLPLNISVVLIFLFIYLRLLVHEGFSDIKDIESDSKEQLLTLPIILEREELFIILSIITILAVIPIIYGFYLNLFPSFSLMLLLTVPYTFYYLRKIKTGEVNTPFLNYVLVDGEYILWSAFILLGKFLL